jgi:hypothetical protein
MALGASDGGFEKAGSEARFESIGALRAFDEGEEIAVRTDAGPIDGRVGTIDDRGDEHLLFVQPTDLQQVQQYASVVSLEEVLLALFATREDEGGWSVPASLVVRTAAGAQGQTSLGEVRGVGDDRGGDRVDR